MDVKTIIDRLRQHNRWRRGEIDDDPYGGLGPIEYGETIDAACAELERIAERAATTKAGRENGAERLCRILYGRRAEIGDTIGGLDAQMLHDAAAELERAGWRDIATAPRDGRGFQAWLTGAGSTGWWEPRCHFGMSGRLGIWRRIDGGYAFDYSTTNIVATHWMPQPSCPTPVGARDGDGRLGIMLNGNGQRGR